MATIANLATGDVITESWTDSITNAINKFDAWATYTPTISASTTPPTGWTTTGKYIQIGKWVMGIATFTFGAGTAAVGTLRFGVPVTADSTCLGFVIGGAALNDSGSSTFRSVSLDATTYMCLYSEAGTAVTGAVPFTPSTADFYRIKFTYLAA